MRVRLRSIILLSIIYLGLVSLLYHFLWRTHALDKLFDTPGEQGPQANNEFVLFDFKRRSGPHAYGDHNVSNMMNQSLQVPIGHLKLPDHNTGNNSGKPSLQGLTGTSSASNVLEPPNYCLHVFYYIWYGSKEFDGRYFHWNHRYLPHWQDSLIKKFPLGRHTPPDDIGASFYPKLGTYSSRDPHIMEMHMQQLREAGIGVVSVSWYPPGLADSEGFPPDPVIPLLLDVAQKFAMKVTLHIEPYENRSALTFLNDLKYIYKHYFHHTAFYKYRRVDESGKVRLLPLIYVYDSYLTPANEWRAVLKHGSKISIRQSKHDCVAIALLVQESHKQSILEAGFDGFYTYFGSIGFSYGSTPTKWSLLAKFATQQSLLFIPSIGPGYDDTRVRPWNNKNTKARKDGRYYRQMFESALTANRGGILSLTSFNEWHEGTQIEPAVPKSNNGFRYLDYSPHSPEYYLQLTRKFSKQLQCSAL